MPSLERVTHHPAFTRLSRLSGLVGGILLILLTIAFYTKSPLARSIWPWSYTTLSEMSYFFLASIIIAVAIPALWIGISGELRVAAWGAIELGFILGCSGIFMLQSNAIQPNSRALAGGIMLLLVCVGLALIYVMTRKIPYHDSRLMPRFLRNSLGGLVIVLTLAGVLLALKQPVFPWKLSGEASIIYGWIFLGAALYFGWSYLNPCWSNASGQLGGFLAYDLVLIFPFLSYFSEVKPENRLSLVIYTAVIVYTGAMSIYYLFISPETRWRFGRRIVA